MTDLKKRFHHFIVKLDTHKCTLSTGNVAVLFIFCQKRNQTRRKYKHKSLMSQSGLRNFKNLAANTAEFLKCV